MTHNDNGLDPRTGTTGDSARNAYATARPVGRNKPTRNQTEMHTMKNTTSSTAARPQARTFRRTPFLFALFLVGFGLLAAAPAFAKDYTFTWTANPEPVEGYKLYYKKDGAAAPPFDGTDATAGAAPINVGKVTTYTITGLDDNATYHFALTAYNGSEESGYSAIVTVNPTAASTSAPAPQLLQIKVK